MFKFFSKVSPYSSKTHTHTHVIIVSDFFSNSSDIFPFVNNDDDDDDDDIDLLMGHNYSKYFFYDFCPSHQW